MTCSGCTSSARTHCTPGWTRGCGKSSSWFAPRWTEVVRSVAHSSGKCWLESLLCAREWIYLRWAIWEFDWEPCSVEAKNRSLPCPWRAKRESIRYSEKAQKTWDNYQTYSRYWMLVRNLRCDSIRGSVTERRSDNISAERDGSPRDTSSLNHCKVMLGHEETSPHNTYTSHEFKVLEVGLLGHHQISENIIVLVHSTILFGSNILGEGTNNKVTNKLTKLLNSSVELMSIPLVERTKLLMSSVIEEESIGEMALLRDTLWGKIRLEGER